MRVVWRAGLVEAAVAVGSGPVEVAMAGIRLSVVGVGAGGTVDRFSRDGSVSGGRSGQGASVVGCADTSECSLWRVAVLLLVEPRVALRSRYLRAARSFGAAAPR
jgi:hypothetical protein